MEGNATNRRDGDVPLVCDYSGIGTGIPPRRPPLPLPILASFGTIAVAPPSSHH
jgi:hypothetical protein